MQNWTPLFSASNAAIANDIFDVVGNAVALEDG